MDYNSPYPATWFSFSPMNFEKLKSRTPLGTSKKPRTLILPTALEKVVAANLIFEVNPFVAIDYLSLHGNAV